MTPGVRLRRLLLPACGLLLAAPAALAHPLDEYVQASYLTLAPDRVRLDLHLTPGVEVAARVVALIDRDGDGAISRAEATSYAARVLGEVTLAVNGRALPLTLAGLEYSPPAMLLTGEGSLHLRVDAGAWQRGSARVHRLSYRNAHEPVRSAYLVNAYLPEAPISITRQRRDWLQHEIDIEFTDTPGGGARGWSGGTFVAFLVQGIRHIFAGPDHVLFVVGLLLLPATLPQLLKVVSAFTVAHSVTLALATLGVLQPAPRLVEPAIAASIVFVGVHALRRREGRDGRVGLAFAFGLLHGFGFAYALREMELASWDLGWSLLSFNLGVEVGQACIVLLAAPLLWLLRRHAPPGVARRVLDAGCILIILAGSLWFIQRLATPA